VALIRDRKPLHVTAIITEPPATTAASANSKTPSTGGSDSANIHPGLAGATLADAPNGGIQIRAIEPRSAADQARLRTGDRIEAVNSKVVANLAALREVAKKGGTLVLTVRRGNSVVLVPLRVP